MEVSKICGEGKRTEVLNARAYHADPNSASCCSRYRISLAVSLTSVPFWERDWKSGSISVHLSKPNCLKH